MADGKPGDKDGKGGGQGRRFGRRRGFRGRPRRDRPGEGQDRSGGESQAQDRPEGTDSQDYVASRPDDGREPPTCPLCGKPVYDLSTALSSGKEEGEPAHFDCVLDRVAAAEPLEPGEKVVYLGSGSFAVVVFKDRSESSFTVKRRIQWEKEGEKKEWRKGLSSRIANL